MSVAKRRPPAAGKEDLSHSGGLSPEARIAYLRSAAFSADATAHFRRAAKKAIAEPKIAKPTAKHR